jgi:hypothetical protein
MFVLDPGALLRGRIVPTQFEVSGVDLTMADRSQPVLDPSAISSEILAACLDRLLLVPPVSFKKTKLNLGGNKIFFDSGHIESGLGGGNRDSRNISADGVVGVDGADVPFSISGEFQRAADNAEDLFTFGLKLKLSGLEAEWVRGFHGLSFTRGTATVTASGKGTIPGGMSFDTRIETAGLKGFFAGGHRRFSFDFPGLAAVFEGEGTEDSWDIKHLNLSTGAWSLTGRAAVELIDGVPEAFSVSFDAPFMPYPVFRTLVPVAYLPAWLNERILERMSGGGVRVDRFSLEGTSDELRKFKLSSNPALLSLGLTWDGIKYEVDGAEIPFEDVSGRLDLADGVLQLSRLSGKFAESEVNTADFKASPVWKPRRYLTVLEGDFDLKDLYRQQRMFFVPERLRALLARFESVRGRTAGAIDIEFRPGGQGFRLLKAAFDLADCGFYHRDLPFPVQGTRAKIVHEKQGNLLVDASGFFGSSEMSVSGSFDGSGAFQGTVKGNADVNEWIGRNTASSRPFARFSRDVPFSGSVFIRKDQWRAHGEALLRNLGVGTDDVSMQFNGTGDSLSFKIGGVPGRSFQISGAEARLGGSTLKFTGDWDSEMPGNLDVRVSSEYFNTPDAGLRIHGANDIVSAVLAGNLDLRISFNSGASLLRGAVTGELESSLDVFRGFPVGGCRFSVSFGGRSVAIESFTGIAAGGAFNLSGTLTGWKPWRGNLSVHARDMLITDFFPAALKSARNGSADGLPGFLHDADIGLSWILERMTWNRMLLERVKVESRLNEGMLRLDSYDVLWDRGSIGGSGSVRLDAKPELSISGRVSMESQPLETLLYGFGSAGALVCGDLTMEGVFSTRGGTRKELVRSLSGNAGLLMTEGVIRETRVLFQVLESLSLQQIFRGRPADVAEDGFYFKRIEAEIPVSSGIAQIESAVMRSPVFNATGMGAVDLLNGRIEGDLHVQPLGSVDALVSRIPLLGYILAGENSTVLVYRFKISGKISEPVVEYVPLKDLGKSAAGYIKRMLLTPGRLFQAFSDAVTGDENGD